MRSVFALLSILTVTQAQVSLPIISDPSFLTSSAEGILRSQLSAWNIQIGPIDLHLNLASPILGKSSKLTKLLGLKRRRPSRLDDTLERDERESGGEPREERAEERGLGLKLGLGLGDVLGLDLGVQLGTCGWGEADNVARGDRGDTEWFTYITVGTPPQSIPVLPDTGSSDLFVFGSACSSCSLNNHTSFEPSASQSYVPVPAAFDLEYADGSGASGTVGQDTIAFGSSNVLSTRMNFGLASRSVGSNFRNSKRSGVLGLGLPGMSTLPNGTTFFSDLVSSGQIKEKVMSVRLEKGTKSGGVTSHEGSGAYVFGGIEDSYIRGGRAGLRWIGVTSANYWGFPLDDISLGLVSVLSSDQTTPKRAIIDTGTSLIITSDTAAANIHRLIPGSTQAKSNVWYIPCGASFPSSQNLFFTVSGVRYGVPVEDLAWKQSDVYPGLCISGVQGGMPHFTVLGDMFIKNRYVVLSYEGTSPQVGLGERVDVPPIY